MTTSSSQSPATPATMIHVHNHGHVHLEDSMGTDLHIVNNARVSFDQGSEEFSSRERGLLNFLMRERHGSPWESVVFRFDVKCPLFVIREWQRHRVGCLAGDTEVTFVDTAGDVAAPITIGELDRTWRAGRQREVRDLRLRVLNEEAGEFAVGSITDVIDSGLQPVYEVVTDGDRTIEMTSEHRVFTPDGWRRLGELAPLERGAIEVSDNVYLMANGVAAPSRTVVAHPVRVIAITYVGVKQTYDLSVEGPWHNFVANGLVVHNSFNEQSARYSEIPDHYYVPSAEGGYIREQKGKPGAYFFDPIEDEAVAAETLELLDATQRDAFAAYYRMLELGVAKELARTVLPVGMFSRMKWTVNLRALFNFLSLRNHEHAQREIRDYAVAVEQLAKTVVPVAFEVFEENGRVCP